MSEQVFDKCHAARLTQLADHLENAETLGVGDFDFSVVYSKDSGYPCGSAGCAMGECSALWPLHFGPMDYATFNDPNFQTKVSEWFGLTGGESDHLFYPGDQYPKMFGGERLGEDATRYQVASNIRCFLEIKSKESA